MAVYLWVAGGLVAAAAAVFFALTNSALRWFSRTRLEELLRRRNRLDDLRRFYEHHDELLQMARSLHIMAVVAMVVLVEVWATDRFGPTLAGWLIGAAVASCLTVILAGIIPLAWAKHAAESVLAATLPASQVCLRLFAPGTRFLSLFDSLVRRMLGTTDRRTAATHIEEEIRSVTSEGEREGLLDAPQIQMIENVLRFRRADISQIMTPRTDLVSLDCAATAEEARLLIVQSGHSRIPVTRGNIDTIVGILYAKDLLERACGPTDRPLRAQDVARPPLFVPETKRLDELLREFQGNMLHMAIVLDEYGGTAGLVTIEDIVEEIVGEIADEYEQAAPRPIRQVAERTFDVEARVRIGDLNDELGLNLPEHEDYETVGGFVLSRLGTIPKAGETLEVGGLRITVLEAEPRRVTRLRLDLPAPPAAP